MIAMLMLGFLLLATAVLGFLLGMEWAELRKELDVVRALSLPPTPRQEPTLNEEARDHPPYDNPRDAFASPDRMPPGSQ